MSSEIEKEINKIEHWIRLGTFVHGPLIKSLRNIFHNKLKIHDISGFSRNPKLLYQELLQHQNKLNDLLSKKVINKAQYELLFPKGKTETDSNRFDVTLLVALIRCCNGLPHPAQGWKNPPPDSDKSLAAFVLRAQKWRNEHFHESDPSRIDDNIFEEKWGDGVNIVRGLGYTEDTSTLKTACLDPRRLSVVQTLVNHFINQNETMKKQMDLNTSNITSVQPEVNQIKIELDNLKTFIKVVLDIEDANDDTITALSLGFDSTNLLRERIRNVVAENLCDLGYEKVLPEVIDIVSENIGESWKHLARNMGIRQETVCDIDASEISPAEKMHKVFDSQKTCIWGQLKLHLIAINRIDIVDIIKQGTMITLGIKNASIKLKSLYVTRLMKLLIAQVELTTGRISHEERPREDAYVDLAIIDASEIDEEWKQSDRKYHLKTAYLFKANVKLKDLFAVSDKFVITRGVAGIGKTTMTDTFVLKWAKKELLNGKVDFLFKFTCRDLNTIDNINNAEELLEKCYPTIFETMKIQDLNEISGKVLILIDGIDELKDIHLFQKQTENPSKMLTAVYNLLNVDSSILPGHKTLVAGRPEACAILRKTFADRFSMKLVEICGFNSESVNLYIHRYFNGDDKLINAVKTKINESENLAVMSTIPIYTWVICEIFKEDINFESPQTTTQLCTFACLLFLCRHFKKLGNVLGSLGLEELISKEEIKEVILVLSNLSKVTLQAKKVVFTEDDLKSLKPKIDLEETGFICKNPYSAGKSIYQFRHLVLQEYLTSLDLYLFPGTLFKSDIERPCFSSCVPMIAGLHGIEKAPTQSIVKTFVDTMVEYSKKKGAYYRAYASQRRESLISHIEKEIMSNLKDDVVVLDSSCLNSLSTFYEYQGEFSRKFTNSLSLKRVSMQNLMHHVDIRNALHFIEVVQISHIQNIIIQNIEDKKFPVIFFDLLCKFFNNITVKRKSLWIFKDDVMSINARETEDRHGLTITIPTEESAARHEEMLMTLFHIVDEIDLYASLSAIYAPIRAMILASGIDKNNIKIFDMQHITTAMVPIDVNKLQINVDGHFLYSPIPCDHIMQLEKASSFANAIHEVYEEKPKEQIFRIGLPDDEKFQLLRTFLENSIYLFDAIVLDISLHPFYGKIKSALENWNISTGLLEIRGVPNPVRPLSLSHFEMCLQSHLSPKKLQNHISLHLTKSTDGQELLPNPENIFVVVQDKNVFLKIKPILKSVIHDFHKIILHFSLNAFYTELQDFLSECDIQKEVVQISGLPYGDIDDTEINNWQMYIDGHN
ncbi:uncharacterized protein LOC130648960 [Hydractinia symbiolongicarpus]|uniref:uncharacterized protein LOC130648960 n=1 Tax=Hydractinia symbiolongicarpus TaxID=13093 RepID=UPI00254D6CCB|nr:uncharacterized protein LOC130648960 [Hydractinia symbiolongicarpus]